MPTPTYDLIASNVLSSATSSVTFSSIPATYRDLVLVARPLAPASSYFVMGLRFNGDTGSNYNRVSMAGSGSAASSSSQVNETNAPLGYLVAVFPGFNNVTIAQIMDYSATDKHKTVLTRANTPEDYVEALATRWASTSAIDSVTVMRREGSADFPSGSTFYLYGIVS